MIKKISLLIIQVVFCLHVYATTYYIDAVNGADNNNGTTPSSAWETISKVNASTFNPGDSILFNKNQTFRGNLTPKNGSSSGYITYGAYGTGSKPLLLGSINRNLTSDWISVGTNIWKTSNVITIDGSAVDAGNLILNGETLVGRKMSSLSKVNSQGKFFSDVNDKSVTMYSISNPGSVYSNIEIALKKDIINNSTKSYVIYENLDLRYGGAHGIGGRSSHHIIIRDMNFSYIGGSYLSDTLRYGNGVEFYNDANTNSVERCVFSQIYDVAMTSQGNYPGYQAYDLCFKNNIVYDCEQSFEFWVKGTGASAYRIYFVNNTCLSAGTGWSHAQRPDPNGTHLLFYGSTASFNNIIICNNIFRNAVNSGVFEFMKNLSDLNTSYTTINNNDWDVTNILAVVTGYNNNLPIIALYNWNYYQINTGQDANSITTNPLVTSNYSIPFNSPCVNAGANLSYVTSDYFNTARPQGSSLDIGACEFLNNNLVTNPTFNINTANWSIELHNSATAGLSSVSQYDYIGNACKTTITNPGSSGWEIQLMQLIQIVSGKTYTVKFRASASANRTIGIAFQQSSSPYTTYYSNSTINITTIPTNYGPYTFTCTTTDASDYFKFMLGSKSDAVWIDDVEITESSSPLSEPLFLSLTFDNLKVDFGCNQREEPSTIILVDISGKIVYKANISHISTLNLPTKQFVKGMYFLSLIKGSEKHTSKIIIR